MLDLPATGILPAPLFRPSAFMPSMTATVMIETAAVVALAAAALVVAFPRVRKCNRP